MGTMRATLIDHPTGHHGGYSDRSLITLLALRPVTMRPVTMHYVSAGQRLADSAWSEGRS